MRDTANQTPLSPVKAAAENSSSGNLTNEARSLAAVAAAPGSAYAGHGRYQAIADESQQVKQLQSYQAMADQSAGKLPPIGMTAPVQREPFAMMHDGKKVDLGEKSKAELEEMLSRHLYKEEEDKQIIEKELEKRKSGPGLKDRLLGIGASLLEGAGKAKKMATHRDTSSAASTELVNHDEERRQKAGELATTGAKGAAGALMNILTLGIYGMVKAVAGTVEKGAQAATVVKLRQDTLSLKAQAIEMAHNEGDMAAIEQSFPTPLLDALEALAKDLTAKSAASASGAIPVVGSVASVAVGNVTDSTEAVRIIQSFSVRGNPIAAKALELIRPPEDRAVDAVLRPGYSAIGASSTKKTTYGTFDL